MRVACVDALDAAFLHCATRSHVCTFHCAMRSRIHTFPRYRPRCDGRTMRRCRICRRLQPTGRDYPMVGSTFILPRFGPSSTHSTRCALHTAPCTLRPACCALHAAPSTLRCIIYHTASCAQQPTVCILRPAPLGLCPTTSCPGVAQPVRSRWVGERYAGGVHSA